MNRNIVSPLMRDGKYNKDSFERFGDDLCQLLLSFLPLNTKLKFECVSKQWKSLIFDKQFVLDINKLEDVIQFIDYNRVEDYYYFNERVFETVFKKCPFIKHLKININKFFRDNGSIFQLMANNCRYLDKFEFCFNSEVYKCYDIYFYDKFSEFGDKCGLKIKFLDIKCKAITDNSMKQLLEKTPNVRKVDFNNISAFVESNNKNFLQNLNEVKFRHLTNFNDEFKLFADENHGKIKSITGSIGKNDLINVFIELSRFEKLNVLNISEYQSMKFAVNIDEGLKMIANKCLDLKHLSFSSRHDMLYFGEEIFKVFSYFKSLNSLSIDFCFDNQVMNFGQLNHLSNIKNLSKLSLEYLLLNDKDFENIDLYLPNLRSIRLSRMFRITDKTLEHLSKLPKLSSIKVENCRVKFNWIQKLIHNSSNLSYIEIKPIHFGVEDKFTSIEPFIELSKRKPKLMHKFGLNRNAFQLEEMQKFEINYINTKLSKNLIIIWL